MNKVELDLRHSALRGHIKKLDNINLGLNEEIESHMNYLEDVESIEELKSSYYDLLVSIRDQANLLNESTESLQKFNNDYLLNNGLTSENHIKPFQNEAYKKEILKVRY
jgi:allophanate hydrolase subunit 1